MPLVSAKDFPGVTRATGMDISPITQAITQALGQRRQQNEVLRLEEIENKKNQLNVIGRQFLRLVSFSDGAQTPAERGAAMQKQRSELFKMAQAAVQRGEDDSVFLEGAKSTSPDEMNLYLTRIATRADETGKLLTKAQFDKGKGTTAGLNVNAPVTLVNDAGEKKLVSPVTDKRTGLATLSEFEMPEGFRISTETPEEKRQADILAANTKKIESLEAELKFKPQTARDINLAKQATAKAEKAFTQIDKVKTNVLNLQSARQAVVDGAGTGPIESLLPSFRAASVALDAAEGRLGLDIVQATSFGALSKGELDLSKEIALPKKLEGPELIKWIDDKISAQERVSNYLERQAVFLSEPNEDGSIRTVADWVKKEKELFNQAMVGITEDDIKTTMQENDMTRDEVLVEIRRRFESGGP